jgi:stringent starvation protein B
MRVPDKRQTLLSYLQRGVAMVHLDARRPGVVVPERYLGDAHLRLNLSYRYSIPDLEIDDRRVQATLSFGGQPFHCMLPWQAIFGITSNASGDGQVWPEDLPVEVVQTMADRDEEEARPPRPALAAVGERPAPEQKEQPAPAEAPRRHLRLVR